MLRVRKMLDLQRAEIIRTRSSLWEYLANVAVCAACVLLAWTTPFDSVPVYIYCAMPLLQISVVKYHEWQLRQLSAVR